MFSALFSGTIIAPPAQNRAELPVSDTGAAVHACAIKTSDRKRPFCLQTHTSTRSLLILGAVLSA